MGKRQQYTAEFKRETVRLMKVSEGPSSRVTSELGVRRNQLYKWKDKLIKRCKSAFPGPGRGQPIDELTRLRQELEHVKEERDILKKVAACFAKELK